MAKSICINLIADEAMDTAQLSICVSYIYHGVYMKYDVLQHVHVESIKNSASGIISYRVPWKCLLRLCQQCAQNVSLALYVNFMVSRMGWCVISRRFTRMYEIQFLLFSRTGLMNSLMCFMI